MDRTVDNFPYKKILFLNWYEAALAHLLLFKSLVEKYSNHVYFLISEQGILLKAKTIDYLKKADDEITKFFTAKIQELEISASADFYTHILEDIKEQTDKLKEIRDCPYINLVYSEKFRNSCLAMKKHGYLKPYENWECHERQRKGFCFLIVRPEHRWKEIASNVYTLVRKREASHQKTATEISWPVDIGYEKFIWFYLKQSFKKFKKNLEIKENKSQRRLTIVIKRDISELNDLEKEIDSLNYFYRPTRPQILEKDQKIVCLSPSEVQKITQLVYHEFGLPNFVKELRKKMSGFLVIGLLDNTQHYESIQSDEFPTKARFNLEDKEDIYKIQSSKVSIVLKLNHRYSLVNYQGTNYLQLRLDKPIKENMERTLKVRLPCLPKYYYWYEKQDSYFIIRNYYHETFEKTFTAANSYDQMFMLYNLICIVEELHERDIVLGNGIMDSLYMEERRIIVEVDQWSTKEKDIEKLIQLLNGLVGKMKEEERRQPVKQILGEKKFTMGKLLHYLQRYIDFHS